MDTGEKERRMNKRRFKNHDVGCYMPTPGEIRRACARIRAKWSPQEEASRRGGNASLLAPQMVEPLFGNHGGIDRH